MSRRLLSLFVLGISLHLTMSILAQISAPSPNDPVRVTVSLNADGSRTTYQFDNARHEATATTTDSDGRSQGKIVYQIGEAGRFVSGVVFGPDEKFLFNSVYKYDAAGGLEEETHLGKDDALISKIVYKYDSKGKDRPFSLR